MGVRLRLISEDTVTIDSEDYQLSRDDDILNVTNDDLEFNENYTLVSSIPATCENDAIEITSVDPDMVTEGEETTFIVNFDYRLASKASGIIYLGFNTRVATQYILTDEKKLIDQPETSSGSLSGVAIPVTYTAPDNFGAYVNISETGHTPVRWVPLTANQSNVKVNPAETGVNSIISTRSTYNAK